MFEQRRVGSLRRGTAALQPRLRSHMVPLRAERGGRRRRDSPARCRLSTFHSADGRLVPFTTGVRMTGACLLSEGGGRLKSLHKTAAVPVPSPHPGLARGGRSFWRPPSGRGKTPQTPPRAFEELAGWQRWLPAELTSEEEQRGSSGFTLKTGLRPLTWSLSPAKQQLFMVQELK